jgi:hypothetical protein
MRFQFGVKNAIMNLSHITFNMFLKHHPLQSIKFSSASTSGGQTTFWVGGDYTPVNEYI